MIWRRKPPTVHLDSRAIFVMFSRFVGNYSQHECGLSFTVLAGHRGDWICELEKYHVGFNKRLMEPKQRTQKLTRNLEKQYFRYGEVRYGQITMSVLSFRFDICSNKTYLQSVKYPEAPSPLCCPPRRWNRMRTSPTKCLLRISAM